MSPTRNNSSTGALDSPGFTMVELVIGLALAMILTAAMLVSYTFLVRSLIRSTNQLQLEAQSRRALQIFGQDVRLAIEPVPSFSASQVILRLPNGSSSTSFSDVAYTYNANAGNYQVTLLTTDGTTTVTLSYTTTAAGTLTRIYADYSNGNPQLKTLMLLTGASNFSFNYFDQQNLPTTNSLGIKQIETSNFTVTAGSAITGTQAIYTCASARLILRNKHLVTVPN
jgi:type II secretory pathway pseudopilin PulG